MTQDEYRAKNSKPGKGWVWSDRLQKWRRPAARKFMLDRQGIHIVLGAVVAMPFLALAALKADEFWMGAWFAVSVVVTHLFLRYEEVEAKEIADDAYIDIGGYLGGFLVVALVALVVGVWLSNPG